MAKLFVIQFVLLMLFILTLAFEWAVLYGNMAFSMVVLSTKQCHSSFSKNLFVFHKTCLVVRVMKMFKMSSDCHIKICRSFKGWAIVKIPRTVLLEEAMFFLLAFK